MTSAGIRRDTRRPMRPWRCRSLFRVIRTVLFSLAVVFAALPHPVSPPCAMDCAPGASSAATCCVSGSHCPISDGGRARGRCCCVSDREVPALSADLVRSRTPRERGQAETGFGRGGYAWDFAHATCGSTGAVLGAWLRAASTRAADGPGTAPLYERFCSFLI